MTEASPAGTPEPPESPASITQATVRGFFAADFAAAPPDAKVYVSGAFFSLLRFPSFPQTLPNLGIVAVLDMPFHESLRDHNVTIRLVGPDEEELPLRVEARFRTMSNLDAEFGEPHRVPLAANVTNVEFRRAGQYHLVLSLDGRDLARYPLRAAQAVTASLGQGTAMTEG